MRPNTVFVVSTGVVARSYFLKALAREAPEVLDHLRDVVMPGYAALPDSLKISATRELVVTRLRNNVEFLFYGAEADPVTETMPAPLIWSELSESEGTSPLWARLGVLLKAWGRRFNLTDPWLMDWALETLWSWDKRSRGTGRIPFRGLRSVVTAQERHLIFENYGWDLEFEEWGRFKKRLHQALDMYLEEYGHQLSRLAAERGWTERPETRNQRHYRWLVLFQVKQMSPAAIAESGYHNTDPSTILKAVEKAATLCGLTLRGSKKGRRAKTPRKR